MKTRNVYFIAFVLSCLAIIATVFLSRWFVPFETKLATTAWYENLERMLPPSSCTEDATWQIVSVDQPPVSSYATVFTSLVAERCDQTHVLLQVKAERGYSGPINFWCVLNADNMLTHIEASKLYETPGFGMQLVTTDWLEQFQGTQSLVALNPEGTIDAMTGASISSRAALDAINAALEYAHAL